MSDATEHREVLDQAIRECLSKNPDLGPCDDNGDLLGDKMYLSGWTLVMEFATLEPIPEDPDMNGYLMRVRSPTTTYTTMIGQLQRASTDFDD